jgi:hypothetical protein
MRGSLSLRTQHQARRRSVRSGFPAFRRTCRSSVLHDEGDPQSFDEDLSTRRFIGGASQYDENRSIEESIPFIYLKDAKHYPRELSIPNFDIIIWRLFATLYQLKITV